MSTPVLMEVAPSESNVARPPEALEEEWVAVAGGGFQRLVEYACRPGKTIVKPACRKPRASTVARSDTTVGRRAKKPPVKKPVEYFEDHCENTQCSFRPGHAGLCSHHLVTGRRGGRVSRSTARCPAVTHPPVAHDFLFDLNDSD